LLSGWEGEVTVMAAAGHGGPGPDLYQLLGVPREASREEIAQAWRRRARDEHPDARPADTDAPGRFRALAEAWQVLADPARRAAYDRALARERQPAVRVRVTVRRLPGPGGTAGMTPLARAAGPPLRAGPVRVEGPRPAPPTGGWDEEDVRLAVLAELALRYLARDRGRPW
jgi:curved DNA-binding protein CbpA